jgi:hypothetical protein
MVCGQNSSSSLWDIFNSSIRSMMGGWFGSGSASGFVEGLRDFMGREWARVPATRHPPAASRAELRRNVRAGLASGFRLRALSSGVATGRRMDSTRGHHRATPGQRTSVAGCFRPDRPRHLRRRNVPAGDSAGDSLDTQGEGWPGLVRGGGSKNQRNPQRRVRRRRPQSRFDQSAFACRNLGTLETTPILVRARGLEPPLLSEPDPKSGASAIPPRARAVDTEHATAESNLKRRFLRGQHRCN